MSEKQKAKLDPISVIYVASGNKHKVKELAVMLAPKGFAVRGLESCVGFVAPEETGSTFLENARLKARALRDFLVNHGEGKGGHSAKKDGHGMPCPYVIADDSGLVCDDLSGEPGVLSARYAGPNATDAENNQKLVEMFNTVTHWSRTARYVCVLYLIKSDGTETHFEGVCEGVITLVPKGVGGFGYDPHFYLEELNKTMAELTLAEKNKISHRAKALNLLIKSL